MLPLPCHPDRSEAKRRDLRFHGPFVEMFSRDSVAFWWTGRGIMRLKCISDGFYAAKPYENGEIILYPPAAGPPSPNEQIQFRKTRRALHRTLASHSHGPTGASIA